MGVRMRKKKDSTFDGSATTVVRICLRQEGMYENTALDTKGNVKGTEAARVDWIGSFHSSHQGSCCRERERERERRRGRRLFPPNDKRPTSLSHP